MRGHRGFRYRAAVFLLTALAAGPAVGLPESDDTVCAEADRTFADQGGVRDPAVTTVLMFKYRFCPRAIAVARGTTVRWINVDKRTSHSIWLRDAGEAESVRLFNMESHQVTFLRPGTFPYVCGPHEQHEKMLGQITVNP